MNTGLNQKQFKAFLQLLKKDLKRIVELETASELKEQLQEVIETIQIMIED